MSFGGRLTLVPGSPVMSYDATSTTLYYAPYCGNSIPIGGADCSFLLNSEDQIGLSLSLSGLAANSVYDIFASQTAGVPYLMAGPAWTGIGDIPILPVTPITIGTGAQVWVRTTAAFDGITSKTGASSARCTPSNNGQANYIGQDWGAVKTVSRVTLWGPNDDYMRGDATHNLPVTLDGWDGIQWVNLYTGYLDASWTPYGLPLTITALPNVCYSKHRIGFGGNGINAVNLSQVKFYEPGKRTSDLTRYNGILVNASIIGLAAQYAATYLGTICTDAIAGQVTAHFTYGAARKFGVWNAHNQVPIILQGGAPSPSSLPWWYIPSATAPAWAPVRNNLDNSVAVLTGLPQTVCIDLQINKYLTAENASTGSTQYQCGIGWNQSLVPDSSWASSTLEPNVTAALGEMSHAQYVPPALMGIGTAIALENYSHEAKLWSGKRDMVLSARWMG